VAWKKLATNPHPPITIRRMVAGLAGKASAAVTARTALVANFNGTALQLSNTSAGAAATALTLSVAAGHPPMKVNTATKVTNLNADYVDGLDSNTLTRVTRVGYNLAPGAVSAPITVPANRPVQLVGVSLTSPIEGVGQVSLLRSSAGFVKWAGFSYYDPTIRANNSTVAGTLIVYLGTASYVYVETAGPSSIRVHNNSGLTVTGSVSLMW
jgi:hypothetical protein